MHDFYAAAGNISDLINLSNFTFDTGAEPGSFTCLNVSITDDQLVEETEILLVCGCSTQPAVLLLNDGCTNLHIEDNDGMPFLSQNISVYLILFDYSFWLQLPSFSLLSHLTM